LRPSELAAEEAAAWKEPHVIRDRKNAASGFVSENLCSDLPSSPDDHFRTPSERDSVRTDSSIAMR
jgi:hypothetical protein